MPGATLQPDNTNLREIPRRDCNRRTTWPPDRASLLALVDLGLSDDSIANYFRVPQPDVVTLRRAYNVKRSQTFPS